MSDRSDPALQLEQSWSANAALWTAAVRAGSIQSRRLATDRAIVQAVLEHCPARVLDLGCGEGWLARALYRHGIDVVGVDGSEPLIQAAREAGGGAFRVLSYADLVDDPLQAGSGFAAIAANFALLQEEVTPLLQALKQVLAPGGTLIVQTVHPWTTSGPYRIGWRTEDFCGFGREQPWQPMPWYFRTLESWSALLRESGYVIAEVREPRDPETNAPFSLLLIAVPVPSRAPPAPAGVGDG